MPKLFFSQKNRIENNAKKTDNDEKQQGGLKMEVKIKIWMLQNKLSVNALSKKLRYTNGYISAVINGTVKGGKKIAEDLEKITNGLVTVDEVLQNYEKIQQEKKSDLNLTTTSI
jgi:hypothetical protein